MAIINVTLFDVSMTAVPVSGAKGITVASDRVLSVAGTHVAKPSISLWSVQLQLPALACAGTGLVSQAGVGLQAEQVRSEQAEQVQGEQVWAEQVLAAVDGLGGYALRGRVGVVESGTGFRATAGFAGAADESGATGSESGATSKASTTNGMNPIDPRDFRTSSPPG